MHNYLRPLTNQDKDILRNHNLNQFGATCNSSQKAPIDTDHKGHSHSLLKHCHLTFKVTTSSREYT